MFYYVDCPHCKKDISRFAEEEKIESGPIYCPYCETALRLKFTEMYDEEMESNCGIFWFEKWEEEEKPCG
jgi:uncharacterized protein YbaR (Trm112 family)